MMKLINSVQFVRTGAAMFSVSPKSRLGGLTNQSGGNTSKFLFNLEVDVFGC